MDEDEIIEFDDTVPEIPEIRRDAKGVDYVITHGCPVNDFIVGDLIGSTGMPITKSEPIGLTHWKLQWTSYNGVMDWEGSPTSVDMRWRLRMFLINEEEF